MKKFLSTKILMLVSCMAMMLAFSVSAQEEPEVKEYTRLLFWVEDSLGNRDSCWFIGRPDATDGIDAHLGEVNLFGVPPQNPELDIRIIQRTDKNEGDYWLYDRPAWFGNSCVPSFSENIDLKVAHRWELNWGEPLPYPDPVPVGFSIDVLTVVLEITATNYPVRVYIQHDANVCNGYWNLSSRYFLHEKNGNGECLGQSTFAGTFELGTDDCPFYTINSSDKNYWISWGLNGRSHTSIETQEKVNGVFILPNPTNNFVIIEGLENEEIRLFDTNGTFISSFEITENPYRLDISNLPNGAYYIINRHSQFLGKFIKGEK